MSTNAADMARMLQALDAADKAHDAAVQSGDADKAAQIAQEATQLAAMIQKTPTSNVIPPQPGGNTSGGPPPSSAPSALSSGRDTLQVYNPFGKNLDTGVTLNSSVANQLAGAGSAFHNLGQGIGQKIGLTSNQDVQDTRDTDKELMSDPNGRFGNVAGNVVAMLPSAAIPGVSTLAGATLGGGLLASMQPSTSPGEQVLNTELGMAAGPVGDALPEAGRLASQIPGVTKTGQLISFLLPGGAQRAATRILQSSAGNQAQQDQARLALEQAAKSGALASKYNIKPTTAQLAGNTGLAQLDRTLRNQPTLATSFGDRDSLNHGAIDDILSGISGSPADRLRAGAARDYQARTMYDDALNNPDHFVQPPSGDERLFENEARRAKSGIGQDSTPSTNDPNAPASGLNDIGARLQKLLQRPAMAEAMSNASRIAANFGKSIDDRNLIQQMHYAKMHLDDQIAATAASNKSNDMRSLLDTKNELLGVMDDLSPAYAQARQNFSAASKPLNRMEMGEFLRQKYTPGLGDAGSGGRNPATFSNALRNGDQSAQTATGFGGAKLSTVLNPDDIIALGAANRQLGREGFAQNAGRGMGSPTAQNLASQRELNDVGQLSSISPEGAHAALIATALHHPAAIPLTMLGSWVNNSAKARLADMALDPNLARAALAPKASLMQKYGSLDGLSTTPMAGAIAANQGDAQGHADGGSVDDEPLPKKSSFWDLVQQAYKELTSPSNPAPSPPVNDGLSASGYKGRQFDNNIDQGVAQNGG